MKKQIWSLGILLLIVGFLVGCGKADSNEATKANTKEAQDKIQVMASFSPMAEFAKAIGKDKVNVQVIIPEGVEAHDFEPKAKDLVGLNDAKVFIYNGLDFEPWVEKGLEAVDNKELLVVNASENCDVIKIEEQEHTEEEEEHKEEEHTHGSNDPHVWLSLKMAQVQANNIKEAFIQADEKNKEYYEANYTAFAKDLETLYTAYKTKFDTLSNKSFVTGHAAFAYFCRDFGLVQNSVEGVFAEGQATPKKLKELVEFAKEKQVKTVFVEEMASPKISETLAREVGATTEKISTLETIEEGKTYLDVMKENLEKVYTSLK